MRNFIRLSGAILKVSDIKTNAREISCNIKIDCGSSIVDCKISLNSMNSSDEKFISFHKFSEKILTWKYATTPELVTIYGYLNSQGDIIIIDCRNFIGPKAELDLEATVNKISYSYNHGSFSLEASFSGEAPDGIGKVTINAFIDKDLENALCKAGFKIGGHSTFYFDITETGYELVGCLPLT